MTISLRPIEKRDLKAIVGIHMRAFPTFFLTFLGRGFLREFYGSFCGPSEGIGFVAVDSDSERVIGVVVGPVRPGGYFKRLLKRRWWAFCLHSTTAVLKRPSIIPRLLRAFTYRGDVSQEGPSRALLSSIAVEPEVQRSGAGKRLVEAFVLQARSRGVSGVCLTTDQADNEAVNGFYQRLGWTVESTFETPDGRKMNRYAYDFGVQRPNGGATSGQEQTQGTRSNEHV